MTYMMNRLLVRCSACIFTSSAIHCSIRPQPQNVSPGLSIFKKNWPLHTILDLWSFMSFQIALLFSMNLWILMWHMVVFDLSLFSWAFVQLKSEFNFDLLEYLETRFVKLEIINDCVYMVLLVDLICANKFVRQESHAWLKTKIPFVHNFTCQSDHLVQFACTHIVVQNKSVTATLMKSDNFVLSTLNS